MSPPWLINPYDILHNLLGIQDLHAGAGDRILDDEWWWQGGRLHAQPRHLPIYRIRYGL